jgi:hypothetical protein
MPPKKEEEIKIPESVMRASNEAFRNSAYGTNAGGATFGIPAFPSSPNVSETSGFSRSMPASGGGQVMQIASPYGFAQTTLTPQQQELRAQSVQQAQQAGTMPRTQEQQQALLAQMRERGAAIGQRLAGEEATRQQGLRQGYYTFRQGLAKAEEQRALAPSFGTEVTEGMKMRGAQATAEAERWRLAQTGRSPMSQEPISSMGLQWQRGSMGQYSPVRGLGGGPQPQQGVATSATPAPIIPDRSLGLTAENPLAFTPFGRTVGESAFRTPEIPPVVRSPLSRNVASSMRSPLGIPRFPYLRA